LTADTVESVEFIAWAGSVSHADMFAALKLVRPSAQVRSAGFMRLAMSGDLYCDGHSESLNVGALPIDSKLANNLFRME